VIDRGTARLYEWFDRVGFAVERGAIHREFPDVATHEFVVVLAYYMLTSP
jgi:hypothetical protein